MKLENKNQTLEHIIFEEMKYSQYQLATAKGIAACMDKLSIVITKHQSEKILKDLRKAYNEKFECVYKDLVDFMTKRKINI